MQVSRSGITLLLSWIVVLAFFVWWSYAFVDGNLTLLRWSPFVRWQTDRWADLLLPGRQAGQYLAAVGVWWGLFLSTLLWLRRSQEKRSAWVWLLLLVASVILLLGHNAHSRDIYNYLFNTKMVWQFGADPHVQTALDFSYDPWIRFMHNVHTPAPYGYGWTAWSLIPFVLSGAGASFLASYLAMRVWMVLGWGALMLAVWFGLGSSPGWTVSERRWRLSLVALHPLILMETLLNGHNDVWMLAPAVAAWSLLLLPRRYWHWPVILGLLLASAFIKYATVVVWPLFVLVLVAEVLTRVKTVPWRPQLKHVRTWLLKWGADVAAVLLVVPLFTARSQQFHPWYATWFLAWLPLGRSSLVRWVLLGLSLTSQLRYLPWIYNSLQFTEQVQWQMRLITWSGAVLGLVFWSGWQLTQRRK